MSRATGGRVAEVDARAATDERVTASRPVSPEPRGSKRPAGIRWRRPVSWTRHPAALGAVAVAAVAVLLRAGAVGFGLPVLTHPDEPVNFQMGARMARSADWNPHFFNYPSMLYDVIAVFAKVHTWVAGRPTGGIDRQNFGVALTSEPGLFLALRSLTLLLSVAICVLAFLCVLRATGRVLAALLAGLLLAVSPVVLTSGVFISPDTYSGVFAALALLGSVAAVRGGRRLDYVVAGVGAGLTAGAKYNAAVVAVAVIAAHVIRHRGAWWRRPEIMLSGVAAAAVFVLVTPASVLDSEAFVTDALREAHHYANGHPGFEGGGSLWYYLRALRPEALLLAGGCLSVLCLRSRYRREVAVLLVFAVAYGALISLQEVHFARNLLPVLPALAMLAGFAAALGIDRLASLPRRVRMALAAGAGLAVVAGLALSTAAAARVPGQLQERPRFEALRWLDEHLPAGSHVVIESFGPYIPPGRYTLTSVRFITRNGQIPADTAAIVVTELGSGRFLSQPRLYPEEISEYRALRSRYCLVGRWTDGPWVEVLTPCDARRG